MHLPEFQIRGSDTPKTKCTKATRKRHLAQISSKTISGKTTSNRTTRHQDQQSAKTTITPGNLDWGPRRRSAACCLVVSFVEISHAAQSTVLLREDLRGGDSRRLLRLEMRVNSIPRNQSLPRPPAEPPEFWRCSAQSPLVRHEPILVESNRRRTMRQNPCDWPPSASTVAATQTWIGVSCLFRTTRGSDAERFASVGKRSAFVDF